MGKLRPSSSISSTTNKPRILCFLWQVSEQFFDADHSWKDKLVRRKPTEIRAMLPAGQTQLLDVLKEGPGHLRLTEQWARCACVGVAPITFDPVWKHFFATYSRECKALLQWIGPSASTMRDILKRDEHTTMKLMIDSHPGSYFAVSAHDGWRDRFKRPRSGGAYTRLYGSQWRPIWWLWGLRIAHLEVARILEQHMRHQLEQRHSQRCGDTPWDCIAR